MTEKTDTAETPKTPAMEAAELAEKEANTRKLGAEADKAAVEAGTAALPDSSSKGPEGKIEIGEGVGLIADLVAHSLLADAADKVAADIDEHLQEASSQVLLVDSPDLLGSDWPYLSISEQVKSEWEALKAVKEALVGAGKGDVRPLADGLEFRNFVLPAAAAAAIPAVVGAVTDVASLFRADYSISAREVKIGATALSAVLAKRLFGKTKKLNLDKFALLEDSALFTEFGKAAALRLEVQRLATEVKERRIVPADRKVAQADTARKTYESALQAKDDEKPGQAELATLKSRMEILEGEVEDSGPSLVPARAAVAVAAEAIEHFDSFATAITKAPEQGYPPLVAAAVREALHNGGYTHVLYAGVEGAAGETLTRRTIFKTTTRFLGGSQVFYLLWEVEGARLVAANSFPTLGEVELGMKSGLKGPLKTLTL